MRLLRFVGPATVSFCVLIIPLACAGHHGSQAAAPKAESIAVENVTLEVDNHNWSDVLLYVVHDGTTERFVEVTATKSLSLVIPARMVGSDGTVRFVAHRIGGLDDYYSPMVSIRTGDTIALTLEGQLKMSSVGVW